MSAMQFISSGREKPKNPCGFPQVSPPALPCEWGFPKIGQTRSNSYYSGNKAVAAGLGGDPGDHEFKIIEVDDPEVFESGYTMVFYLSLITINTRITNRHTMPLGCNLTFPIFSADPVNLKRVGTGP